SRSTRSIRKPYGSSWTAGGGLRDGDSFAVIREARSVISQRPSPRRWDALTASTRRHEETKNTKSNPALAMWRIKAVCVILVATCAPGAVPSALVSSDRQRHSSAGTADL